MSGSDDERKSLLNETKQSLSSNGNTNNPYQSTSTQAASGPNTNDAFAHDNMNNTNDSRSSSRPDNYGYLEHIQSLKPSLSPDNKSLTKKAKGYYAQQLQLITAIEDTLVTKSDEHIDNATAYEIKRNRYIKILTIVNISVNIVLFMVKIIVAIVSGSLSIVSSLVDSAVDLMVSVILVWTDRLMKTPNIYKYPEGRKRLEPIAIVILSTIMCAASVMIIVKSSEALNGDIEYFRRKNDPTSTYVLPDIDMDIPSIVIMVLTVAIKIVLFILCYRIKNPTMYALAEDNRNDVASNTVALICGVIASEALRGRVQLEAVVIDPIGAIIISVYIIIAWILQANRQVRRLTGISAEPYFLQQITHVAYNHRPDVVQKIRFVQAVYHGTNFYVEVHISLPGTMSLGEAHDIGSELQKQLETVNDVERAFVHLDFETSHEVACEHKSS